MNNTLNKKNLGRSAIRRPIGENTGKKSTYAYVYECYNRGVTVRAVIDECGTINSFVDEGLEYEGSTIQQIEKNYENKKTHILIISATDNNTNKLLTGEKLKWLLKNVGGLSTRDFLSSSNVHHVLCNSLGGLLYHWVDNPTEQTFNQFVTALDFWRHVLLEMHKNTQVFVEELECLTRFYTNTKHEDMLGITIGCALLYRVLEDYSDNERLFCNLITSISRTKARCGDDFFSTDSLKSTLPLFIVTQLLNGKDFANLIDNTTDSLISRLQNQSTSSLSSIIQALIEDFFPSPNKEDQTILTNVILQTLNGPKLKNLHWSNLQKSFPRPLNLGGQVYDPIDRICDLKSIANVVIKSGRIIEPDNGFDWGVISIPLTSFEHGGMIFGKIIGGARQNEHPGVRVGIVSGDHKSWKGWQALSTNGGYGTGKGKPTPIYDNQGKREPKLTSSIIKPGMQPLFEFKYTNRRLTANVTNWSDTYHTIPGYGEHVIIAFKGFEISIKPSKKPLEKVVVSANTCMKSNRSSLKEFTLSPAEKMAISLGKSTLEEKAINLVSSMNLSC